MERLGSVSSGGFEVLKKHIFFAEIEWEELPNKTPPTTSRSPSLLSAKTSSDKSGSRVRISQLNLFLNDIRNTWYSYDLEFLVWDGSQVITKQGWNYETRGDQSFGT